jgi:hypothetical protein
MQGQLFTTPRPLTIDVGVRGEERAQLGDRKTTTLNYLHQASMFVVGAGIIGLAPFAISPN